MKPNTLRHFNADPVLAESMCIVWSKEYRNQNELEFLIICCNMIYFSIITKLCPERLKSMIPKLQNGDVVTKWQTYVFVLQINVIARISKKNETLKEVFA